MCSHPAVKAFLFDFVGVLLCRRPEYRPVPLVEAVDAVIGRVVDDHQFKTDILRDYILSEAEFDSVLQAIADKYVPFEPLWELLPELKNHYQLAIINNGTWLTYPYFNARYHLEAIFDHFISSAHEGIAKPDLRIYQRACKKLGVEAAECLFMDDSPVNVMAAQRTGMQGIPWPNHAEGFEQLMEMLKNGAFHRNYLYS